MEKLVSHFSLKKRQLGLEIGPLLSDVNIQQIGPYRLSRPCVNPQEKKHSISLESNCIIIIIS